MTRGTAWIDVEGLPEPIHVAGGDFVLLAKSQPHIIRDSPSTPARPAVDVLGSALPPVIHVTGDQGPSRQWLESSLQWMSAEMASGQLGAETVVRRLADILLVQAPRAHVVPGW